jgi:CheY-like chemotaxis protein
VTLLSRAAVNGSLPAHEAKQFPGLSGWREVNGGVHFMAKKILLVEDEKNLQFLYEEELKEEGYEVVTANNGREALQRINKARPDLVLMDIAMPEMDGLEALARIREKDRKVPVILHTSHRHYQDDARTQKANGYILKSANLQELKEKIDELLNNQPPSTGEKK